MRLRAERRAALVSLALSLAACGPRQVVRLVDGFPVAHHPISVRAYASYARGAAAEATGAYEIALADYIATTDADGESVEPWVREGAVACTLGRFRLADAAFDKGEARDPAYEPLWTERAKCLLSRNDARSAASCAERAEALDPDDDDAVRTHADALDKSGDSVAALRELAALGIRHPSPATFRAELAIASRTGDEPARAAAFRSLEGALGNGAPQAETIDRDELDRRLAHGDVEGAERLGRRLGLSASMLALRAAALGLADTAKAIADPIVRADPGDADALVAALAARSATIALPPFVASEAAQPLRAASPLALLVLSELLAERVGPDASVGTSLAFQPHDPLEQALVDRLRRATTLPRSPEK